MNNKEATPERRTFLKTAGAAVAAGFPGIISAQTVTNAIRVGMVGCGGRGSGAASQALAADDYAELTAAGDIDQGQIDQCLSSLKRISKTAGRVKVEADSQYVGLDAFQKVIDSKVDVVILATPPGFRPQHLAAAIGAGKHVFCEKPAGTDAPGVRSVLASTALAEQKNLSLMSGFCWRYNNMIQDTVQQVDSGAIGRVVAYYATYYTSPVKPIPPASTRPAGMSDVEWQIRNWYNFVWLCGDSLVEQAVHSADKIAWVMHDEPPVSCVAVGGRTIPAEGGNIYDHFEVNYIYPNGVRAFLANRQIVNCYNENSDYILGTDGTCTIGRGPQPRIEGKTNWTFSGQQYNMYQREHDVLFAAIRKNTPVNNGKRLATSTMLAIMGRMAAYTGQQVTWDQALNSQEKLVPDHVDWKGSLPVPPRAEPGVTKLG
ncbi:MAG TPA: Gfo/Idh/MocA family oxidoreductase [Candidatus Acidoferrum sp.]|jgi:myo-inositol 2-dehydrogenase/D-chiro-inositol 1-dehydrogenase|nr:Gfo/Idh/MocA family oxidoreductase [Candidatus Acidoferrum sp.]